MTPPAPAPERRPADARSLIRLVAALVAFGFVFDLLGHGGRVDEPTDLDVFVNEWVVTHRSAWPGLTDFFHLATRFGDPVLAVTATVAVTAALLTLARRGVAGLRWTDALAWLGAILGGRYLSAGLKLVFRRERPPPVGRLVDEATYSFPSGHSVFAAAFCTMLAFILVRLIPPERVWERRAAVASCFALAVVVGVSRVWLGVHYPTDVLGGLLLGAGWVLVVTSFRRGWAVRGRRPVRGA